MGKNIKAESVDGQDKVLEEYDTEILYGFFDSKTEEAEKILEDEDTMEKFLQKLEAKLKTVPVAGNSLSYIPIMISLIRSYVKKEYTETPITSMVSIVVTLIYFLSPIDLIPDGILGVGYIDDAVIVAGCLALVRTDLEDYRIWRKENGYEFEDVPDYEDISKQAKDNNKILKAFFSGRKSVKK